MRSAEAEKATDSGAIRAIAFYLPQFHPIPENDRWWGSGFTEWTNVTRARPIFAGHYQPHLPADMGFYDLRVAGTRKKQAALAAQYGIHGFCYYYYWFAGKRLLEMPIESMRASGEPDFPYCLCWANENWTRRWDGADREILIAQNPSREDDEHLIRDLLPHFRDPRYIRVAGRPLFMVYRIGVLPDAAATAQRWREIARAEGIGELYLCAAKTYDTGDPSPHGFDAVVEFPPHGLRTVSMTEQLDLLDPRFTGTVVDYRQFVVDCIMASEPSYALHRTVMPGWDNTARRMHEALVFAHASPEVYELWLREVAVETRRKPPAERLLFINAWNEWAEGAHLEPDRRFGHQYLEATARALAYGNAPGVPAQSALAVGLGRPRPSGSDPSPRSPAPGRAPSVVMALRGRLEDTGPKLLKPAVFLHIQKTAGTTMVDLARPAYGANNVISHGDFLKAIHSPSPGGAIATDEDVLRSFDRTLFLSGHFGYGFAKRFMPGRYSFTFLRDPVERILSLYYFCRRRDPDEYQLYRLCRQVALGEFLQMGLTDPEVRSLVWNHQVWQLACGMGDPDGRPLSAFGEIELLEEATRHLDELSYVGFAETFEADRDAILADLGIARPNARMVSNANPGRPAYADLPPATRDLLLELTELDRALYDRARSRAALPPTAGIAGAVA